MSAEGAVLPVQILKRFCDYAALAVVSCVLGSASTNNGITTSISLSTSALSATQSSASADLIRLVASAFRVSAAPEFVESAAL